MNTTLYIDNKPVDLFKDDQITLVQKIKDLRNLGTLFGDFTQSFSVPATPHNNEIFKHYYKVDLQNGFNPHYKVDAELGFGGTNIFNGVIELKGVKEKNREPNSYTIVFYGVVTKFSSIFGEDTLQDIDFSSLDHIWDFNNIVSSWQLNFKGGNVFYPVIDFERGFHWSLSNIVTTNIYQSSEAILDTDLRPSFLLREIVRLVFANYGLTIAGDWFTDPRTEKLFMLPMRTEGLIKNLIGQDLSASADKTITQNITGSPTFQKITFDAITYDPSASMNIVSSTYTASVSGSYRITFDGLVDVVVPATTSNAILVVYINGAPQLNFGQTYQLPAFPLQIKYSRLVPLLAGDTFWVGISTPIDCTVQVSTLNIPQTPISAALGNLPVASLMPDITIVSFIDSILEMYNAILLGSGDNAIQMQIVEDWYKVGITRNWTNYIDTSSIEYEKINVPRDLNYTHAKSEDMQNTRFEKEFGRKFGSTSYVTDFDFAEGSEKIETVFTIIPPSLMPELDSNGVVLGSTDLQIPHFLTEDTKPTKLALTLLYYQGVQSSAQWNFTNSVTGANSVLTTLPYSGTYSERPQQSSTNSLAFSIEDVLRQIANAKMPLETLFKNFYSNYISRIYDVTNRYMTCVAVLPIGEYTNFRLNDTILINGFYWKVEELRYNMNKEKAFLKLFKYDEAIVANNVKGNVGFVMEADPNFEITNTFVRVNNLEEGLGLLLYAPSSFEDSESEVFANTQAIKIAVESNINYVSIYKQTINDSVTFDNVLPTLIDIFNDNIYTVNEFYILDPPNFSVVILQDCTIEFTVQMPFSGVPANREVEVGFYNNDELTPFTVQELGSSGLIALTYLGNVLVGDVIDLRGIMITVQITQYNFAGAQWVITTL